MVQKKSASRFFIYLFLFAVSLVAFVPFYCMMIMGTYYANDLYTGLKFLPGNYLVENFKTLMSINIFSFYKNSLIVSCTAVVLGTVVCAAAGYGFAKFNFRLKKVLFAFVLMTLMVPTQLGVIAYVMEMNALGLRKSLLPLILPYVATPFGVYWITQFAQEAIPTEVLESAKIDGAGELTIFTRIAMPLMRPAMFTLGLLIFLWTWNNFFLPVIMVNDPAQYTITLGIRQLATAFHTDYGAQILGVCIGTVPVLLFFSIFNKNLISGLSAAAVKG